MCEAASGSQLCGARGSARGHVVTWIGWVGGELQEGGDKCIHMVILYSFIILQKLTIL